MEVEGPSLPSSPSPSSPPPLLPVLTLTEEELLVLTEGDLGVVPPRLRLPDTPDGTALVSSVALRTLMARRLVTPAPAGEDETQAAWTATEPLGLTLALRALAPRVLGLQRLLGPRAQDVVGSGCRPPDSSVATRYLHLHEEIGVIEDVTPEGMHSFLTVYPERYADAVSDFIRPPGAVAGQGGVRRLGDSVEDLLGALGDPAVLVEVSLITGVGADALVPEPVGQVLTFGLGGTFRSLDSISYRPVDPDLAIRELVDQALGREPTRPQNSASSGQPQGDGAAKGEPRRGGPGNEDPQRHSVSGETGTGSGAGADGPT